MRRKVQKKFSFPVSTLHRFKLLPFYIFPANVVERLNYFHISVTEKETVSLASQLASL